jgi:hypothetical protein
VSGLSQIAGLALGLTQLANVVIFGTAIGLMVLGDDDGTGFGRV